jgi:ligand-binding sensor domain-containing protein
VDIKTHSLDYFSFVCLRILLTHYWKPLILNTSVPSTDRLPLRRSGTWRTYTPVDGLAGLRVGHMAEDAAGFLWFGTKTHGVSRFDGDAFRTFTKQDGLSGNQVMELVADRQDRLWAGTSDGGLSWYDGSTFQHFGPNHWIAGISIHALFVDRQGRLWFFGMARGAHAQAALGYVDGLEVHDLSAALARVYQVKSGDLCWGITQDEQGHLWFGMGTLVCYDGLTFSIVDIESSSPEIGINCVTSPLGGGPLWVGGGKTIGRFDLESRLFDNQTYAPIGEHITSRLRKIRPDRQGRTWLCTSGDGAFCLDGDQVHHFTPRDGLAFPIVNDVLEDREEAISGSPPGAAG